MQGDPEYTIVTVFNPNGTVVLFEIEETPFGITIKAQADHGCSYTGAVSSLLCLSGYILPDSATKFRIFQAARQLKEEGDILEDRMTDPAANSTDDPPF